MAKPHPSKLFTDDHEYTSSDKKLFEFYKNNPTEAFKDLLNQDLAPFQRVIVKGNLSHPFVMNVLARGSGKTRLIAGLNAFDAMFNPKIKVAGLSAGFRNSKLIFNELEAIYEESEYLQQCVINISKQPDVWTMEFFNGAKVYALPLAADSKLSIRGIRAHKIRIDEYPQVPKEVIDAVIKPMGVTTLNPMKRVRQIEKEKKLLAEGKITEDQLSKPIANSIQGFSSAYYQFNHFYTTINQYRKSAKEELIKFGKTKYAVYVFNINDGPDGFFDKDAIQEAKTTTAPIVFRMEYLSEFPSDSDGFFKRSLLDSCISRPPNDFDLEVVGEKTGRYWMGVDPAREKDAFAIQILKLVANEMRLVKTITYQSVPFPIIAKDIRTLTHTFNIVGMGMDKGGGGLAIKDLLADPMSADNKEDIILDMDDEKNIGVSGRQILKMVDFSSKWIEEANYDLQSSFEHKRLLFPNIILADKFIKPEEDPSDPIDIMSFEFSKTINELQSIVVTATKNGSLHWDTPNQYMRKDRYSALLVAHKILYDFIKQGYQQKELASGGWLGPNGIVTNQEDDDFAEQWTETGAIEMIAKRKNSRSDVIVGALVDK